MQEFLKEVERELLWVENKLHEVANARVPLLNETSIHLLNAGGKRLRPALSLLAGKCCSSDVKVLLPFSAAVELVHMATLVHDDVVDTSFTRRGVPTVKAKWGNRVSMQVGDFLFAQSLIMVSDYKDSRINEILAKTGVAMCEGEMYQIYTSFQAEQMSIKNYFYRIKRKTALLIAVSCQMGALICGAGRKVCSSLRRYGHNIGMAFQITDDILDFTGVHERLGKPVGNDLRQGLITMPVIYAIKYSKERDRLKSLILSRERTEGEIEEAVELVKNAGGVSFSVSIVNRFISKAKDALSVLPESPSRAALSGIADFIALREY